MTFANAQQKGEKKHIIFFKNYKQYDFTKIAEGQKVRLVLKEGDTLYGPIQRIRRDTISIMGTVVILDEVTMIDVPHFGMRGPVPPVTGRAIHMEVHDVLTEVKYTSDTSVWEPVYPPEEVYHDPAKYFKIARDVEKSLRIENRETNHNPLKYNNFIKFNLARLVHLELSFAYERAIGRGFTLESEISYIFGIQHAGAYYMINYPIYNFTGFSALLSPKYYFNTNWYVTPVFMYKYGWVTGMRTDWPLDNGSGNGQLQDECRNDYAGSLRVGYMKRFGSFVVDWYLGIGGKYSVVDGKTYGEYYYHGSSDFHWYNADHSPNIYTKYLWAPAINAGIKIGLGF